MKMRCPYCHEASEWQGPGKCPKCGKAALSKGFYARSGKVKKEARRRERDIQPTPPWLMSGRLMGFFLIWTKIPRWVVWLCGLSVIGAFVFTPKISGDFPELRKSARESLAILNVALDMFKEDCGRYPTKEEGLEALAAKPEIEGWHGPYIRKLKKDPWNHPYVYWVAKDGSSMRLRSNGPDGKEGGGDDIYPDLRPEEFSGPLEVEVNIGTQQDSGDKIKTRMTEPAKSSQPPGIAPGN